MNVSETRERTGAVHIWDHPSAGTSTKPVETDPPGLWPLGRTWSIRTSLRVPSRAGEVGRGVGRPRPAGIAGARGQDTLPVSCRVVRSLGVAPTPT